MNKEELISKLKDKFEYVSPINFPVEQKAGLSGLYIVDVLERINETTVVKKLVRFYVKDLNMDSEEVIFDGWNPFAQTSSEKTFIEKVQEYAKNLLEGGSYEYITIEDVNETTKRAFCWAYQIQEDGTLAEKAIIVYYGEDGKLTHKEANVV